MSAYNLFGDRAIASSLTYEQVRPVLRWVYVWMTLGLLITAAVAFITVNSDSLLQLLTRNRSVFMIAIFAELGVVIGLTWGINRISAELAAALFIIYSALNGFTLSLIFLVYDLGSVATAFLTTAGVFGVMSIIGFTTTYDLTKFGAYFLMGLIGLLIAMVVNIFLVNSALYFLISIAGVLIFTGLTAYDTQRIKNMAAMPEVQADASLAAKMSIFGALKLYLDFINLFLFLLRLFGRRR